MTASTRVLDGWALLAAFQDEPASETVRSLPVERWRQTSHPISYADCFAAALALQCQAELVTGDPEFRRLGNEIAVHWLKN